MTTGKIMHRPLSLGPMALAFLAAFCPGADATVKATHSHKGGALNTWRIFLAPFCLWERGTLLRIGRAYFWRCWVFLLLGLAVDSSDLQTGFLNG